MLQEPMKTCAVLDVYKRQENECEKFDIYNEKLMVGSNRTKLLKELER